MTIRLALLLVASALFGLFGGIVTGCGGPQGSTHAGATCNFPTVLEQTPGGGDQLLLCGNGDVLECRNGSCAIAAGGASSGSVPTTSDSNNPTDSGNRTTINNPPPTPTPRFGG